MFYDMILNMGREKRLVWDTKFRASSVVYYTVRYPLIAFQVFQVSWTPTTPHCDAIDKATWAIALVPTRTAICISFILRVYAVTGGGYFFSGILSLVGLLIVGLDIWQDTTASCMGAQDKLSTVLTFISLIVFDVITTGVICWRLLKVIREGGGYSKVGSHGMAGLVLRSGVLYFMVMTVIQAASVALYFAPQGTFSTVLNNYTLLISSILTARFLLDLRSVAEGETEPSVPTKNQDLKSMAFAPRAHHPSDSGFASSGNQNAWGTTTLMRDFDDHITTFSFAAPEDEDDWPSETLRRGGDVQLESHAWPMEDLADRARRAEEQLAQSELDSLNVSSVELRSR